jgi:LmbE family N-acetylglucosaminyl deacetylase
MNNVEFDKISRPKNISFLADFIEEYSPDILISHHRSDVHPDHAECNKLCNAALLKIPRNLFPNEFYMCQSYYGDLQNSVSFEPTTFVDISDVAKIKYEILSQYKSQDYQFWIKMITAMDDLNGLKTGVKKAEAFQQSPAFSGHARPYL